MELDFLELHNDTGNMEIAEILLEKICYNERSLVLFRKNMKKYLLLVTTLVTASCAKECQNGNRFEFLAGLNTGFNIGKYGVNGNDFSVDIKEDDVAYHIWNEKGASKSKFAPFIEAELAAQYLMNNTFIGVSIGGGNKSQI